MLKISINNNNNLSNNFNKKLCEQEIEKYFKIIRDKKIYNQDIFQETLKVRELRKIYLIYTGKHYKPIIIN